MRSSLVHKRPEIHVAAEPCKSLQSVASQEGASSDAKAGKPTYSQILKSSALIGGSSVLNIGIGIVRTKAMAVMLGPAGFGVMGLYGSVIDFAVSVAGMGIGSSGVRQIAAAVGSGDERKIARTVFVLRQTSLVLGVVGAFLVAVFCREISTLTFGSDDYAVGVGVVSLAVLFRVLSAGQGALIQGMRRIQDLAAMGVIGALLSAIASIGLVLVLGEDGVAASLAAGAGIGLVISWWYSRKVRVQSPGITGSEVRQEAASLLKLGFAFMTSGILMMGAAYAVRAMVLRMVGLDAAGFYQAAWTLGGLYVGIILQAMGADFYPRLVAVANADQECNRVVNEQAHVSMLLAAPGVIATLAFAPIVISLFYTAQFGEAVEVLRWICLGIALRVITWPIGFIIVAKNRQAIFFGTELAWTVVNIGLTWLCLRWFGLKGAGMAFFGSYVFHALIIYPIVRALNGFRWSETNLKTGLLFVASIVVVFCGVQVLPPIAQLTLGMFMSIASGWYSSRTIAALFPADRLPPLLQRLPFVIRRN